MPLFSVEITYTLVVAADDARDAECVAERYARDAVSDSSGPDSCDTQHEITSVERMPFGWDARCAPYGEDGRTIGDILAATPAPETVVRCTQTVDMFKDKAWMQQ